MDERLKEIYEQELHYLDSHIAEFAATPGLHKLANQLGLGEAERAKDPFVEWLLEGTAFLSARIQHLLEADFPRFSGALLDVVFPHLSAPTPSMMVVAFGLGPNPGEATLAGATVPRGQQVGLTIAPDDDGGVRYSGFPAATYRTARSLRLWPASINHAEYLPDPASVAAQSGESGAAGVMVTLTLDVAGKPFADVALDMMDVYLPNPTSGPRLMEAIAFGRCRAMVVHRSGRRRGRKIALPITVEALGFDGEARLEGGGIERDALLPYDRRSFDGYRRLHEYFALPARFRFLRLSGLRDALREVEENEVKLVFLFDAPQDKLAGQVGAGAFRLNCAPAVNLFEKNGKEIAIDYRAPEHEIEVDPENAAAYEVHSVTRVTGLKADGGEFEFTPFYSPRGLGANPGADEGVYYALHRRPRLPGKTLKGLERFFERADYRGSEVALSFAAADGQRGGSALRSVERVRVNTLCTNRLLPALWANADVELRIIGKCGAKTARVVDKPSRPRRGGAQGRRQWDVVSHLSLNYLSLLDTQSGVSAAETLKQMLALYAPEGRRSAIDGLLSVSARQAVGRAQAPGEVDGRPTPAAITRGVEIALRFARDVEEAPILAALLERFFAAYAPATSFTQTKLLDQEDEVKLTWPTRTGRMRVL